MLFYYPMRLLILACTFGLLISCGAKKGGENFEIGVRGKVELRYGR